MRVVQLLPALNLGGVERGVVELSRELTRHNCEAVVVSRGGALCGELQKNGGRHVPFDCGGKNPFSVPARAFALRRLLAKIAPDIVHVRSRVPAWLLRFAGGKFAVISTFHGIYSTGAYSGIMTRARAVICPSFAVREHILRHYDAPRERLHVIHRGVDGEYFAPRLADGAVVEELRRYWRLAGRRVFTLPGRVSGWKGHALFLRAFARLLAERKVDEKPPVALIVGDDESDRSRELRRLADELGIADSVVFGGVCRQMREVYAISDVVASASVKPEAFGRTVAEALAMDAPVIAPAHGGALDIVKDGQNGLLFAPGCEHALAEAMRKSDKLPRQGLKESVAHLSLANMASKTMTLYRQALDGSLA